MAEGKPELNLNSPRDKDTVITVSILGNQIRLKSPKSATYIQQLAHNIEKQVEECMQDSKIISSLKAVILVALNLADQLETEKKKLSQKDQALNQRIDKLLHKITSVDGGIT